MNFQESGKTCVSRTSTNPTHTVRHTTRKPRHPHAACNVTTHSLCGSDCRCGSSSYSRIANVHASTQTQGTHDRVYPSALYCTGRKVAISKVESGSAKRTDSLVSMPVRREQLLHTPMLCLRTSGRTGRFRTRTSCCLCDGRSRCVDDAWFARLRMREARQLPLCLSATNAAERPVTFRSWPQTCKSSS